MTRKPLGAAASIFLSTFVGMAFFLGGYALCVDERHEAYGSAMFLLMPAVSGFAIGAVTQRRKYLAVGCATTCLLSLASLVAAGWEGYICCLMALPLLALNVFLGAVVGYAVRGRFLDQGDHIVRNTMLVLVACPFLMAAGNEMEKPWRDVQRTETFASEIVVPTSPERTWDLLVRMGALEGTKPLLLRVGLPVPRRCTLDVDAVGGNRTCFFDQGVIEQEVVDWRPPESMGVKITRSTLPGRRWLTFISASYDLVAEDGGTRVVRESTIGSRLYPRWYWRPFEAWGTTSEHEFVLSSLAKSVGHE